MLFSSPKMNPLIHCADKNNDSQLCCGGRLFTLCNGFCRSRQLKDNRILWVDHRHSFRNTQYGVRWTNFNTYSWSGQLSFAKIKTFKMQSAQTKNIAFSVLLKMSKSFRGFLKFIMIVFTVILILPLTLSVASNKVQGGFFDCSALKMPKCQTHWKIWHLELFWWDLQCNMTLSHFLGRNSQKNHPVGLSAKKYHFLPLP